MWVTYWLFTAFYLWITSAVVIRLWKRLYRRSMTLIYMIYDMIYIYIYIIYYIIYTYMIYDIYIYYVILYIYIYIYIIYIIYIYIYIYRYVAVFKEHWKTIKTFCDIGKKYNLKPTTIKECKLSWKRWGGDC